MMRFLLPAALAAAFVLIGFPSAGLAADTPMDAAAQARSCASKLGPNIEAVDAADSAAFAASWLPALAHLTAAIPALSPREERWLEEEMQARGDRWFRALDSREYAMKEARRDAGAIASPLSTIARH